MVIFIKDKKLVIILNKFMLVLRVRLIYMVILMILKGVIIFLVNNEFVILRIFRIKFRRV